VKSTLLSKFQTCVGTQDGSFGDLSFPSHSPMIMGRWPGARFFENLKCPIQLQAGVRLRNGVSLEMCSPHYNEHSVDYINGKKSGTNLGK